MARLTEDSLVLVLVLFRFEILPLFVSHTCSARSYKSRLPKNQFPSE